MILREFDEIFSNFFTLCYEENAIKNIKTVKTLIVKLIKISNQQ